jgi:hypothetical protein
MSSDRTLHLVKQTARAGSSIDGRADAGNVQELLAIVDTTQVISARKAAGERGRTRSGGDARVERLIGTTRDAVDAQGAVLVDSGTAPTEDELDRLESLEQAARRDGIRVAHWSLAPEDLWKVVRSPLEVAVTVAGETGTPWDGRYLLDTLTDVLPRLGEEYGMHGRADALGIHMASERLLLRHLRGRTLHCDDAETPFKVTGLSGAPAPLGPVPGAADSGTVWASGGELFVVEIVWVSGEQKLRITPVIRPLARGEKPIVRTPWWALAAGPTIGEALEIAMSGEDERRAAAGAILGHQGFDRATADRVLTVH